MFAGQLKVSILSLIVICHHWCTGPGARLQYFKADSGKHRLRLDSGGSVSGPLPSQHCLTAGGEFGALFHSHHFLMSSSSLCIEFFLIVFASASGIMVSSGEKINMNCICIDTFYIDKN